MISLFSFTPLKGDRYMEKQERSSRGTLFVLLGAVLWGTTGTSQALAPAGADPASIGAVRIFIGGSALLFIAIMRKSFWGGGRWAFLPTAIAVLAIASYQPFFFTGVSKTGVAVGTLVTIGSSPVISGVLGYLFLGEKPERKWYLSSAMAIAGCTLLTLSGGSVDTVDPVGVLFSLGAGFSYSMFVLSSKYLLLEHSADAVNGVVFFAAGIILLPVLMSSPPLWLASPRGLLVAVHLGLIATALSYFLFLKGLSSIPASTSVTISLAEPLTAALLGVFFLGERLNFTGGAGIVLLFAGVALLAVGGADSKSCSNSG